MRLTVYTDYSLRLLMYLAVRGDDLTTINQVAEAYGIAKSHLTKVSHQLGVAGDIETVRGRSGGLRLKRPPASINIGILVRRTESDFAVVPCFDGQGRCVISGACVLQTALHQAVAAFLAVLDKYTLADLVVSRRKLTGLLNMEFAGARTTNRKLMS